jgi:hypothetical protein
LEHPGWVLIQVRLEGSDAAEGFHHKVLRPSCKPEDRSQITSTSYRGRFTSQPTQPPLHPFLVGMIENRARRPMGRVALSVRAPPSSQSSSMTLRFVLPCSRRILSAIGTFVVSSDPPDWTPAMCSPQSSGCYLDVLKYKHIHQYNLLSILEQSLIVQIIEVTASITHASRVSGGNGQEARAGDNRVAAG